MRNLWRLLLWMVLMPGSAYAANTAEWVKVPGGQADTSLGSGQVRALRWSTAATTTNGAVVVTTSAGETSKFLFTGSRTFSLRIEPQVGGSNAVARADLYACTRPALDACTALQWDTNNDGAADDNTLDPTNPEAIGTPAFFGISYIYLDPTVDPASGVAEVTITSEEVGP